MSRVAVVTGGARGIGRAVSVALRDAGWTVASIDRDEQSAVPDGVHGFRADISDIADHASLFQRIERAIGPATCLVNNAGVTSLRRGDMLELTPESFDRCLDVNLRGTFFLTQAFARRLLPDPSLAAGGTIVTITSANAEIVGENRADYCMSKAALAMMCKLFAARLAEAGIRVYDIRPGIIETDMTAPAKERYDGFIAGGGVPMRRWGRPEDVAGAVVALARGDFAFATGIHVDLGGGLNLHRV